VSFSIRPATVGDVPALERLIADSSRALSREDYSPEQIEAALGSAWGVDTQLIADGTYFVVECGGMIAGCGGWSRRKTLFGSDARKDREPDLLDPARDAAKIRAFFVHPEWARKGIGRALLDRCEAEAAAAGFHASELMATLPGRRLYQACGYRAGDPIQYPLRAGLTIEFVPMRKELIRA
jgi:GNAT superfamily N-acetyltransferase